MSSGKSDEFDTRYRMSVEKRDGSSIKAQIDAISSEQVGLLRRQPNRPSAMSYFEEIVAADRRTEELREAGDPVVGSFCNFVPEELIHAAGAVPVRLCTEALPSATVAEEIMPRDVCPVVKSAFGDLIGGQPLVSACDVLVAPLTCDAKKKLAEMLNDYVPTWLVEVPPRKDYDRDLDTWLREIVELRRRLERLTGRKISREGLRESIRLFRGRQEAARAPSH